ncbi:MAG: hypothetical protein IKF47_04265 [Bacilli bacterium]|nr:hypothetical protein [Bacilli bacterium]
MAKNNETKARKIWKKIINILFTIIIIIIAIITIDYIRVAKFEYTPLFAIRTETLKDGGTTEYYGLGYKVIDYNQIQGRRDIEIGLWNMKRNSAPIDISDIDLAIEFTKDEEKTYNKYYKKFLRIKSTLKEINEKTNTITLGYSDEDGKYSLDIICKLVPEQTNISSFEKDKEITIIGTVKNYKGSTKKENKRLYIKNCIAQQ